MDATADVSVNGAKISTDTPLRDGDVVVIGSKLCLRLKAKDRARSNGSASQELLNRSTNADLSGGSSASSINPIALLAAAAVEERIVPRTSSKKASMEDSEKVSASFSEVSRPSSPLRSEGTRRGAVQLSSLPLHHDGDDGDDDDDQNDGGDDAPEDEDLPKAKRQKPNPVESREEDEDAALLLLGSSTVAQSKSTATPARTPKTPTATRGSRSPKTPAQESATKSTKSPKSPAAPKEAESKGDGEGHKPDSIAERVRRPRLDPEEAAAEAAAAAKARKSRRWPKKDLNLDYIESLPKKLREGFNPKMLPIKLDSPRRVKPPPPPPMIGALPTPVVKTPEPAKTPKQGKKSKKRGRSTGASTVLDGPSKLQILSSIPPSSKTAKHFERLLESGTTVSDWILACMPRNPRRMLGTNLQFRLSTEIAPLIEAQISRQAITREGMFVLNPQVPEQGVDGLANQIRLAPHSDTEDDQMSQ